MIVIYPKEYVEYLIHFHGDRDYFECHEILEEYWKKVDSGNKSSIWVAFILLAVSAYHHRRANFAGGLRTLRKAFQIFRELNKELQRLGINPEPFYSLLKEQLYLIEHGHTYKSYNIPLSDERLIKQCKIVCFQKQFDWCKPSNLEDSLLLHRHLTRDRSGVLEERKQALKKKKEGSE